MKLGYTIIYVADVPKTVDFYEKAFSIKLNFMHESKQFATMDTGSTALAFASDTLIETLHNIDFQKNESGKKAAGFEIAFVTEDVEEAYRKAKNAGAESISEPQKKPWGQTVAYVRELNGVIVELCSPMAE